MEKCVVDKDDTVKRGPKKRTGQEGRRNVTGREGEVDRMELLLGFVKKF